MTTQYADYAFYTGTYLGTVIASADFDRLALRASAYLDRLTFDRAADDTDNTTAIKMATCAVAEEVQTIEQEGSTGGIQSEKVGSHSVTYSQNSIKQRSSTKRLEEAARLYLASTFLMFKGFNDSEYGSWWDTDED